MALNCGSLQPQEQAFIHRSFLLPFHNSYSKPWGGRRGLWSHFNVPPLGGRKRPPYALKNFRDFHQYLLIAALRSPWVRVCRLRMKGLTRIAVTQTKHVSIGMDRQPLQSAAAGNTPVMDALPVHHLFQFLIPKKVLPQEIFSDAALEPALTPQKGHHLKTG